MMKNLVIVKSKTINNESISVVFQIAEVLQGGIKDKREISRSYIFKNFESEIPLKLARILIRQNPNEFSIVGTKEKEPIQRVINTIKVTKEKEKGFTCPYCGKENKSKAGLKSHIRYSHPEKKDDKKEKK